MVFYEACQVRAFLGSDLFHLLGSQFILPSADNALRQIVLLGDCVDALPGQERG
jgi:hypothetical protein